MGGFEEGILGPEELKAMRVEVYSMYPKKLEGTISRYALREMGMTASSDKISALAGQLRVFRTHKTWVEADG